MKEAEHFLEKASERGNANQIRLAHELAGIIALARNEFPLAIRELGQASQQNPYNLYRLAQAYAAQGDREMARDFARQAAEFNPLPALNYAFIRTRAATMFRALEITVHPPGATWNGPQRPFQVPETLLERRQTT